MKDLSHFPPAPLWRRLFALLYDSLLVLAIWFISTGILMIIFNNFFHDWLINDNGVGRPPYWFLHGVLLPMIFIEAWLFFAWFWLHGGQTLGMRTWRIEIADYRGRPLRLWQTLARFLGGWVSAALAGAGFWLVLFRPHQSLHDRLSATETRVVPKSR